MDDRGSDINKLVIEFVVNSGDELSDVGEDSQKCKVQGGLPLSRELLLLLHFLHSQQSIGEEEL